MDQTLWSSLPFDDDDDEFGFDEGYAELASELSEYADDDDEFDEFDRTSGAPPAVQAPPPLPVNPTPRKRSAAKKKK